MCGHIIWTSRQEVSNIVDFAGQTRFLIIFFVKEHARKFIKFGLVFSEEKFFKLLLIYRRTNYRQRPILPVKHPKHVVPR